MESLFETVAGLLSKSWKARAAPRHSRAFRCRCGRNIFFRNSLCIGCSGPLGYAPDRRLD